MSTIAEIEAAIEQLPETDTEGIAHWLDQRQSRHRVPSSSSIDHWLDTACGAAVRGATTAGVLATTRGED